MGLVCIQNSSLFVYSKSQKVSASYCLPFQHSRGKNQPVGGFRPPPPGLFRVKSIVLYSIVLYCIVFYCIILHCIVLETKIMCMFCLFKVTGDSFIIHKLGYY